MSLQRNCGEPCLRAVITKRAKVPFLIEVYVIYKLNGSSESINRRRERVRETLF